jgi:flagellar protein FliL
VTTSATPAADAAAATTDAAAPAAAGGNKLFTIIAIAAGLVVGLGGGYMAAGKLFAHPAAVAGDSADAAADDGKSEGGEGGGANSIYTIDNLILNPAQSGGTRFLMLSVAVQMKTGANVATIHDKDPQVRDEMLRVLGSKTVEQLTDVTQRDELKSEIITALTPLAPRNSIVAIYFPHFVIQ